MTLSQGTRSSPSIANTDGTVPRPVPGKIFHERRRPLYAGGPFVSQVGFGSYRVGMSKALAYPECGAALADALRLGMNLIDTSSNYGNGQSEMLIGKVLAEAFAEGTLKREQVAVVTKAGYVQGANLELAMARENSGRGFPEMVKFGEGIWHCLHPEFLTDQLERSLARLKLASVDVFLLHNPEYALKHFEALGMPVEEARDTFYHRLGQAFARLEELADEGRIGAYGISSNTLGFSEDDASAVSLRRCVEVAKEVRAEPRFKVAQCPLNWLEPIPALFQADARDAETTLGVAQRHGMGVLVNRPLNAMNDGGLIRLSRPYPSMLPKAENMDEGQRRGLENWTRLASDLEKLARARIQIPGYEEAPLQQLVLASLAWLPGVSSVLLGCRRPAYVRDAAAALERPVLVRARHILEEIFDNLEFHRESV